MMLSVLYSLLLRLASNDLMLTFKRMPILSIRTDAFWIRDQHCIAVKSYGVQDCEATEML